MLERIIFRYICKRGEKGRRNLSKNPDGIERKDNITYGKHGKWNLLDVYFPKDTTKPLPAIINVHGGGYVYGTKEQSQYYCMDLARRGFAVVNFSYRLVPKIKYPVPVEETNQVMQWVCANAADYHIDLDNIFFTGDSAGAQIAAQYCAAAANPEYAKLFNFKIPAFKIRAVALNCGMYDSFHEIKGPLPGLLRDYFGKDPAQHGEQLQIFKHMTKDFPPAYIMSAANDFLLPCAEPLHEHLQALGVESVLKIYGTKEQTEITHVFHLNFLSLIARECNDAECDFFKEHIKISVEKG
ncbi:MAG: alpha/beta hydrolase [Oscillospiraceae bacterium]|nr:alpha/beta hydrolase [Oscillospiraceae bacterium]